ncbi:methyltransferase [Iodobacter sp. LRB]|uniref:methyltransferase n=1 Tax=unclassified Iodobacter TaxID=235634 RepID=UPI000C0E6B6B|nr:methyltransferase [Iodobacter sp. BJB302]PHV00843.1 methyltransferase [Iodobacter sp. BJB302]
MSFQKNAGAVRRYAKVMKFSAWLQGIPNKVTPPPFRLMQISSAFWQSRALYVAARLDIATVLGDKAIDNEGIASLVSANPDALGRLLRLLAAIGIFEEAAPRVFRNNKLSAFLRTDNPQNVRAMILMHNSEAMSHPWFEQLEQGIRQGVPPFKLSHDEELFSYLDHHAGFDALFSEAMDSVEVLTGDSFASDFDWSRFERIIDVGGSRGTKALAIIKRHPHLTALILDRAQVIAEAERYWSSQPVSRVERLEFQAGDLLHEIPSARSDKDIYLLSAILHGFDDLTCKTILHKLSNACGRTGARIALLEMVLPETGADVAGASFDMQMFMGTRGRERTLCEWTVLFEKSGLALEQVVGLQSFGSILVLQPIRH